MIRLVFQHAVVIVMACWVGSVGAAEPRRSIGEVVRFDPALDVLVPGDAKIEVLAEGLDWIEGPVWVKEGGYLLFSDVPQNTVFRWSESDGLTTYLKPSGYTDSVARGGEMGSNGLAIDAAGHLLLCQHGDRRVASMNAPFSAPKAEYNTVAGDYQGKRFNSPNDLAIHSSGAIYFTDPAYGMPRRFEDPNRELPFVGVFRVSTDGVVTLLTDKLKAPNGIAFSPDEKTLYVNQSDRGEPVLMAYTVQPDGTIDDGRVLFDAAGLFDYGRGLPDGLKVDKKGNLFATGPGGVLVISPEGKHLGTIVTGQATSNCAFGDDGQTLYMTADMYLCRIRLATTGNGF